MSSTISVEKLLKDLVHFCDGRIQSLRLHPQSLSRIAEDNSPLNFDFEISLNTLNEQRLEELKSQLACVYDLDLLNALRGEFARQMRLIEVQNQTAASRPPPPEQHYYKSSFISDGGQHCTKYWHFDGPRVARELLLSPPSPPTLLLSGRDEPHLMCQWNLEEAKVAEDMQEEITESDFNSTWFAQGGYPYVRPFRKVRRFLTSAFKKPVV